MYYFRLQFACFAVLLYVAVVYFQGCAKYHVKITSSHFWKLLFVGIATVIFDGATSWVNGNAESVSPVWSYVFHALSFIGLDATIFFLAVYILTLMNRYPKKHAFLLYIPLVVNIVLIVLTIGVQDYLNGTAAGYTSGMAMVICFLIIGLYILVTFYANKKHFNSISSEKQRSIITFLVAYAIISTFQIVFGESLASMSIGVTILVLGIYMNSEAPLFMEEVRIEKEKSEKLLLNILPRPIAERLKQGDEETIADRYGNVTVLFSDIVGFTTISSSHSAQEIAAALNALFKRFDERALREGVEKIKTIGDAYMAACGLPSPNPNHAAVMVNFARGMYEDLREYNKTADIKLNMRIGLNTGSVVAGVIGETKFIYDIWGDTVNVASRMESSAEPGKIHVSQAVVDACGAREGSAGCEGGACGGDTREDSGRSGVVCAGEITFGNRHTCDIKGKGEMVTWNVA